MGNYIQNKEYLLIGPDLQYFELQHKTISIGVAIFYSIKTFGVFFSSKISFVPFQKEKNIHNMNIYHYKLEYILRNSQKQA